MSDKKKLKPFPAFATDEEAERFVAEADLTEYDFSGMRPMSVVLEELSKKRQSEKPASSSAGSAGRR